MKKILTPIVFTASIFVSAQMTPVGIFTRHADIGNPKIKGDVIYDTNEQSYRMKAGGYNIWFNRDEFHFAYRKLKGDFILTADMQFAGEGKDPHRKLGWMVRASEQDDAAHVSAAVHSDGLTTLQWRRLRGAYMRDPEDEIRFSKKSPRIIQLERSGKTYYMRAANPGEPLQLVGTCSSTDMPDEVLAGIFLCSHNADVQEEALAWNVRIELTVPESYNGYRDGALASRLELLDVFNGRRKIIYENKDRFEAPNWMPDGKKILFNQGGLLYTIPIEGGQPEKLNTGFANRNNNDHVISFDGKLLAISHHREGLPGGGSTIYYLPITGGEPVLVTDSTPSYLHGWSPNNKELVYVAQRLSKSPVYNLYKKTITGGPEVQLTFNTRTHVDGPEFSPDGKYIYYNASESGTMQLWRMKPDGSGKEQITFDDYNNWFPHISPDGKWIVFLSFLPGVAPDDHPLYKKVMLRLMPAGGGAPQVIAYLFGGQGTINTPSWSPDSKRVAFVSNSKALE
jgi:Tol biopolymer transport system component